MLHDFKGHADGANPTSSLIDVNGTLYGTTERGGAGSMGTIYKVTPAGGVKVVYSFGSHPADGSFPYSGLLDVNGTLYGTTLRGGANQAGTVFRFSSDSTEKVLYSFSADSADGADSYSTLITVQGALYGTTAFGGGTGCVDKGGCGTVFQITRAGSEKVVSPFGSGAVGALPFSGLTNMNGTLYGTTYSTSSDPYGAVYSVTTGGVMTNVYSFKGGTDGAETPQDFGSLVHVKQAIYGTTAAGGAFGYGTVFRVTASGEETVVYSFSGGNDGATPTSGLINIGSTLYGTTSAGGGNGCGGSGCGTVFKVTPAGDEQVLYAFAGGADGQTPLAGLLNVNGTLYGTTNAGGGSKACTNGCGTVFAITP